MSIMIARSVGVSRAGSYTARGSDIAKGIIPDIYYVLICNRALVDFDVIVVGSGMAGLAAAHHLVTSTGSASVAVLEGAGYVGGRICAVPWSGGLNLNVGAHWVVGDGPLHPLDPLLAAACNASSAKGRSKVTNFDPAHVPMLCADGSVVPYDWSHLTRALDSLGAVSGDGISMGAALEAAGWSPVSEADRLALWFICDYEWGLSPFETPLYHTVPAPYHATFNSGDQRLIATDGGAPDLLAPLLAALEPGCVRIGERVSAVTQDPDSGLLAISCSATGSRFVARAVIVTVSISVLASGAIAFSPSLPWEKVHTLAKHRCMASYEIVLAEFDSRFWAAHMPDGTTCVLLAGPPYMLIHDLGSYYDGRPILEFHLAGGDAMRASAQTPEQTQAELMAVMKAAFGGVAQDPTRLHCTRWSSDPLTLGAFSVRPQGMSDEEHASLRKACMDGRLLFAGDGMHEVHCGYMHGAYLSGLDAARAALEMLAADIIPCGEEAKHEKIGTRVL